MLGEHYSHEAATLSSLKEDSVHLGLRFLLVPLFIRFLCISLERGLRLRYYCAISKVWKIRTLTSIQNRP